MTAVAATSTSDLARARPRGRAPRRTPATSGPPGSRTTIAFIGVVTRTRRRCGRPRCRRGPRRRRRSGSGAPDGWSQFSARAWAFAASRSISSTFGVRGAGGVPEEVRRDRRGLADHVVGGHFGQVEDQRLVDLGLDVEDVAQLVDPVVEVHRPNLAKPGPVFKSDPRRGVGPVSAPRSRATSAQVSTSSASWPVGATSTVSVVLHQPSHRYAVRVAGCGHQAAPDRRPASWRRPVVVDQPGTVAVPDRGQQPGHGVGGDVRHVDGQHHDQVGGVPASAATPALSPASGPPPGGRLAGERRPARGSAPPARPPRPRSRRRPRRGRARAGSGRRARGRPCRRRRDATPVPPARTTAAHSTGQSGSGHVPGAVRVAGWGHAGRAGAGGVVARPGGRTATGWRRLVPDDADLVVLPEAFARDFGEPGSDLGAARRAARRPVRDRGRAGRRRARHHGRGRDVRAQPTRHAVQHPGGARRRAGRLPQDPPLRLLRLPRVRRPRAGAARAGDRRARRRRRSG